MPSKITIDGISSGLIESGGKVELAFKSAFESTFCGAFLVEGGFGEVFNGFTEFIRSAKWFFIIRFEFLDCLSL